ncbi:MAG: SH3 domain-containing protein [Prevotellaceae bacterium]|jgi:hypothetical protein|nr:SH3 domain-containing protein [Prevotellaceae bacterium]
MKKTILYLALLFVYIFGLIGAIFAEDYIVLSDGLNIRADPNINAKIIGVAYKDEILDVQSITGNWVKLNYKNGTAYAVAKYLQKQVKITEPESVVTIDTPEPETQNIYFWVILGTAITAVIIIFICIVNANKTKKRYEHEHKKLYNDVHQTNSKLKDAIKNSGEETFNIFDEATWYLASDSAFVWKDNTFFNKENDKTITEKEYVTFLGIMFDDLSKTIARDKWDTCNKFEVIEYIITRQIEGGKNEDICTEIFLFLDQGISKNIAKELQANIKEREKNAKSTPDTENSNRVTSQDNNFDIFDFDSWKYATDSNFIWKGQTLDSAKTGEPITEYDAMNLFDCMFRFLERNGDKLSSESKEKGITTVLDRMLNAQNGINIETEELQEKDDRFDPRNPETYQYATNNPLIIDGVAIYDEYTDTYKEPGSQKRREPVTEKSFVDNFNFISEIEDNIDTRGKAEQKAREEYREKGIENPNDQTKGYTDRINELYECFLETPDKIDKKKDIENSIDTLLLVCSPMPKIVKTLGGYGFTQAQLEVLGSLPDEALEAIGKTMSGGLRGGKLNQALFNAHGNLNRDWYYLAKLCDQNEAWEKKVMLDYFYSYEFKTEERLNKLLDESEYLKNHNELKVKIYEYFKERFIDDYFSELYDSLEINEEINDLINKNEYLKYHSAFKAELLKKFEELILKDKEDQGKSIDINNFTIHGDIKQLLWFADGPLKNLTKGFPKIKYYILAIEGCSV